MAGYHERYPERTPTIARVHHVACPTSRALKIFIAFVADPTSGKRSPEASSIHLTSSKCCQLPALPRPSCGPVVHPLSPELVEVLGRRHVVAKLT